MNKNKNENIDLASRRKLSEMNIQPDDWPSVILRINNKFSPALSIKIIMNEDELLSIREEWNNTVLDSSSTIYQTFEWLYCWWKFFGKENQYSLHIVLIYLSNKPAGNKASGSSSVKDKLIGIAPFYIQNSSFAELRIFRRLKLIGAGLQSGQSSSHAVEEEGLSDYLDIICVNGYENQVAETLASYFTNFKFFFDEIDLQNISDNGFIFSELLPLLQKHDFKIQLDKSDICPRLAVPDSFDYFLKSVKSNTRRRFKQALKQVGEDSICKIEELNSSQFTSAFQVLRQLHQKRWNELGYLGLFSDERVGKFQDEVNKEFLNNGWLWFKVLKLEGKIIAARLGFKFNNRFYDYLSGFDHSPASAAVRPGMILILEMIKDAVADQVNTVDFLRGMEEYKFELSSNACYNYRAVIRRADLPVNLKLVLFKIVELKTSMLNRFKSEKSIIVLHINRYGKTSFIKPYLKFCFKRIKTLTSRHNKDMRWESKAMKFSQHQDYDDKNNYTEEKEIAYAKSFLETEANT